MFNLRTVSLSLATLKVRTKGKANIPPRELGHYQVILSSIFFFYYNAKYGVLIYSFPRPQPGKGRTGISLTPSPLKQTHTKAKY